MNTVDADQIDAATERTMNDGKKTEEKERDDERADGQSRAQLLSTQVGKDQRQVLHTRLPA